MRPRTLKLDEENSTYAGLAQEIGFSASFLLEKRVIDMI
jgi:hypothetical protein